MVDFGANVLMQHARNRMVNRRDLYNRLYNNALLAHKRDNPPLNRQILNDVIAIQNGTATPEQIARVKAQATIQGPKTQYTRDALGRLEPMTVPNPLDELVGGGPQPTAMDRYRAQGPFGEMGLPIIDDGTSQDSSTFKRFSEGGQEAPGRPLSPREWEELVLSGTGPSDLERVMEDPQGHGVPTLPEQSTEYQESPLGKAESGKAVTDVQKAGSMLPVLEAEKDIDVRGNVEEKRLISELERQKEDQETKTKRKEYEGLLEDLLSSYEKLDKMGARVKTVEGGVLRDPYQAAKNVGSTIAASESFDPLGITPGGQDIGRALGTEAQAERDKIMKTVPIMFGDLRKIIGLTGKELDNPRERDFYLKALTDLNTDIGTTRHILKRLSERYGTGEVSKKLSAGKPGGIDMEAVRAEIRRRGLNAGSE